MIDDFAEIFANARADWRDACAGQIVEALEQRCDGVPDLRQLLLESIKSFDVRARRSIGEDTFLDFLELRLDRLQDRKVAIDDGIHQRVQHISRTMAQQFRLLFAASSNVTKSLFDTAADRQNVVGTREDIDFPRAKVAVLVFDHMEHGEQRVPILFDLGSLMPVPGVLDGKRVQIELGLHELECTCVGLEQRDPRETAGFDDVPVHVFRLDVGDPFTVLTSHATDELARHLVSVTALADVDRTIEVLAAPKQPPARSNCATPRLRYVLFLTRCLRRPA